MDTVMAGVQRWALRSCSSSTTWTSSRHASRVIAFYDGRIIADAATEPALADPQVRQFVIGESHAAAGASHA